MKTIEEQIIATLEKVRPFLQKDGGDAHFVRFQNGVVFVRVSGSCARCAYRAETITNIIEPALLDEVPGVVKVLIDD